MRQQFVRSNNQRPDICKDPVNTAESQKKAINHIDCGMKGMLRNQAWYEGDQIRNLGGRGLDCKQIQSSLLYCSIYDNIQAIHQISQIIMLPNVKSACDSQSS